MSPRRVPSRIDHFEVIKTLGRGGMGEVFLCNDPFLQRPVAIKVLSEKSAAKKEKTPRRLRFLREAMTTAQLQHPAIPPVYSVHENKGGRAYYVMKPIDGRPLSDILDDLRDEKEGAAEEFDLFRLIEILRDVCQALQYAHSRGVLHRDLKPSNIFVGNYGEVYVIDWGLAKALGDSEAEGAGGPGLGAGAPPDVNLTTDSTITQTVHHPRIEWDGEGEPDARSTLTLAGDILGTLAYMPPEQASGEANRLGPEADLYAMGVILYELLSLELPVEGDSFDAILKAKTEGDFQPPELANPSRLVPPELSAIAMHAMAPVPDDRIRSALDFNRALEFWLEGKSQFRTATTALNPDAFFSLPKSGRRDWDATKDAVTAKSSRIKRNSYFLLNREFTGDVRFSVHVIAFPLDGESDRISEFALVLNAALPGGGPWPGYLDCYSVHLGANDNTRAFLSKNESEVVSNEYVVLEPHKRYRLTVERTQEHIRVMLDRQVILFHQDREPAPGFFLGFLHRGEGIQYSNLRIQERGLPTMTPAINVPEALMDEGCYAAAQKRLLAIAQGHKNRFEGAWARYRAGLANYRLHRDRKRALRIWRPLKKGSYAIFEQLGRATLELENGRDMRAIRTLRAMLDGSEKIPHLEPVADIVFVQSQQRLRQTPKGERSWRIIDGWSRLALILGQRVESKRAMTPSILWRWLYLALTRYPHHLSECIVFLRETFGKGQGRFAEILTTIDPLMRVLRRSLDMAENAYLVDKIMRLILSYDDNLGNLETLARFYLHAGHEDVTRAISWHILGLCKENDYTIPPMPIAFLACMEWLSGDSGRARELFELMVQKSEEWARADGRLLLGLEHYRAGDLEKAAEEWRAVAADNAAASFNRHLVAEGLLGRRPVNPESAEVPHRSDHRLLYCLFLGFRYFLEWERNGEETARRTAVELLQNACALLRPSYDVYSATETFARIPLESLGHPLAPREPPPPLTPEEEVWLKRLTAAAADEVPEARRKTTSRRRKRPASRRKKGSGGKKSPGKRPPKQGT